PSSALLVALLLAERRAGQVAVARLDQPGLLERQVADKDRSLLHGSRGARARVGHPPLRSPHRRRAVAAARPEVTVHAREERAAALPGGDGLLRRAACRGPRRARVQPSADHRQGCERVLPRLLHLELTLAAAPTLSAAGRV